MFLTDPNRVHPVIRAVRAGVSLLLCLQMSSVFTLTVEARSFVSGATPSSGGAASGGSDASAPSSSSAAALAQQMQSQRQSLARSVQVLHAMQQAQAAARAAAKQVTTNVPNGLGAGGLQVAAGADLDPSLWQGATRPVESSGEGGRLVVKIDQETQKAILTWDSFNVGRETDLVFDQQGNRDWVALNRVTDAQASPSQILGSIKADGQVYILNRNGIIFGGASQVNVGNLVAAAANMSNEQFLDRGIYSQQSGNNYTPSFTDAGGAVTVETGAQITTHAPRSATEGGGFVMLLGTDVTNEGTITTPKGQAALSAGDDFVVRRGYGTEENQSSTTRGNEVRGLIDAGSTSGAVTNAGLIEAGEGDITLAGRAIRQDGVLLATTSVNQRGSIHLLNSASDGQGSVTLGAGSLTLILPDLESEATALDSQRDALIAGSEASRANTITGGFDDRSTLAERLDQSRVEIVTGGDVLFEGGSLTMAQGGQVAVQANNGRITVEDGATIDVSGLRGVALDMESHSIKVNMQGNELRDSPLNREEDYLKSQNVWLDVRDLIYVPAGTGGYESDRWYTAGGLLEVGGWLANTAHTIGEWAAIGGTITLAASEVVAQRGAVFDISGGSLDYAAGSTTVTRLLGIDGKLYDIGNAPANMIFVGLGNGHIEKSDKWGVTKVYSSPLTSKAHVTRQEEGYTVGRDAGSLILSAPTVIMEADLRADVVNGSRQTSARAAGITDGYKVGQHTVARAGSLVLGRYGFLAAAANLPFDIDVRIGDIADVSAGLAAGDALPAGRAGTAWFDAAWLNGVGLGGLSLETGGVISFESALTLADGGSVTLVAPTIDINADVTARGGSFSTINYYEKGSVGVLLLQDGAARVALGEGVTLDLRGHWSNLLLDPADGSKLGYLNGGRVSLSSSHDVTLGEGSVIDVSSGGAVLADGSTRGGRGGDIMLEAGRSGNAGEVRIGGEVRGQGVAGGGALILRTHAPIALGGQVLQSEGYLESGEPAPIALILDEPLSVAKGALLPGGTTFTVMTGGQMVTATIQFTDTGAGNTLSAPVGPGGWDLNGTTLNIWVDLYDSAGNLTATNQQYRGNTGTNRIIPGNAVIRRIQSGALQNGYVIPDSLTALPVPAYVLAAGTPAPADIVLAGGAVIAPGTILDHRVAVRPPMTLDAALFQSGFSSYEIVSRQSVVAAPGAALDVFMPVYRLGAGAHAIATGAEPSEALETWTPPLYQENPLSRALTQRRGTSLTLQAGDAGTTAGSAVLLHVADNARISVDPGQSLTLLSGGQLTVDGRLQAHGGLIEMRRAVGAGAPPPGSSVWIGERAVLDVSGVAATALDARGLRYGRVDAGGSILIGGRVSPDEGTADGGSMFVVVREGALLEASGARAVLDVPGRGAVEVASAGGEIVLSGNNGFYIDGTLRAASGGAGAAGGALTVWVANSTIVQTSAPERTRRLRELVFAQEQGPGELAPGATAAEVADLLEYGHARLGADTVEAGGFDTLTLASGGMIVFDGSVNLSMGLALNLYAGSLGWTDAAAEDSQVHLSAPYMRLMGSSQASSDATTFYAGINYTSSRVAASSRPLMGGLTLEAGLLFDVRGGTEIDTVNRVLGIGGGQITIPGLTAETDRTYDRRGFDQVALISGGDMRFGSGRVNIAGDVTLAAAQLYPNTNANASLYAGWVGGGGSPGTAFDPARVLTIARTTDDIPAAMPYSVFGRLALSGPTIDQGGVIRAPLGMIQLGAGTGNQSTTNLNLLPGSLTSVSAAGLAIPYGGTTDGVSWDFPGTASRFNQDGLLGAGRFTTGGVLLGGQFVNIEDGAVIDLTGGGAVNGAGFVSGRGGSTDARYNPLVQIGSGGVKFPGLGSNPIYAIVPGAQPVAAPLGEAGAADPALGRQITIPAGVPGLPAGVYTLLPSTYALLPGAFRVEINGPATANGTVPRPVAMGDGSWAVSGALSIAGTAFADSLASMVFLTPASVLRTYSQYNETSYTEFAYIDAERLGVPRAQIEADAKTLMLRFNDRNATYSGLSLHFDGEVRGEAAEGGFGSTLSVVGTGASNRIEILGDDAELSAFADFGVSVRASDLSKIDVNRLVIGDLPAIRYGQGGNLVRFNDNIGRVISVATAAGIAVRDGAVLSAPEVILFANGNSDARNVITIEDGAVITTLGRGPAAYGSDDGFFYQVGSGSIVALSNGRQQWLPVTPTTSLVSAIPIRIGAAALYSEGSIAFATDKTFELGEAARYGTRHLSLAVGAFNVGTSEALAEAEARGALTPGAVLNQQAMDRLLRGDSSTGAPALQTLELIASRSVNFFGTTTLSTLDAEGNSILDNLMLTTPAIYGYGNAADVARIETGHLIWNGSGDAPGAVVADGAGTGSGAFEISAERISFGYGAFGRPDGVSSLDRLALGFADVTLSASDRITANNLGALSVYQSRGAYTPGEGYAYAGGNLHLVAPLLTGEAGSVNRITAGGAISVSAPAGGAADPSAVSALGAELSLTAGQGLSFDTATALPSGKLSLIAGGDVMLGGHANIDLSGRAVTFFDDDDATRYSWGGDVTLESRAGNITQAAGSIIDLSAEHNRAGRLTAVALGTGAGVVDLQGRILASASGVSNVGGTELPYLAGGVIVRAQSLGGSDLGAAFAALNARLNEGEVFGLRSFQLKQGDLTVGDGVRASQIDISLDGGHLTVAGTVDASGERVGSIRLAGKQGLTIGGNAVLDAHGTLLRLDSYGKIIDAPNRAIVELNSGDGLLTLAAGAHMDLRHGTNDARVQSDPSLHDGRPRGTVELYAPRLSDGDVAIDASGALAIEGARSIALNAVRRYDDAPFGTDPAASGRPYQVVDQDYLDTLHADSTAFITNALNNTNLLNTKLAGLNNATWRDAFHLRPAVEIVSATPDGDIVVSGDLDLSGHRYASLNPHTQQTGVYGSGEAGALAIRAGGDLDIYGSINDGFAPPPNTVDDNGWVLTPGVQAYAADVIVPNAGVVLAEGTRFPPGRVLNYDLPIQAVQLVAGTVLPVEGVLTAALTMPANTQLYAAVRDAGGNVLYPAGTVLQAQVILPAGSRLGAGTQLPAATSLAAMVWPRGVPLPRRQGAVASSLNDGVFLAGSLSLPRGALIPGMTEVVLPPGVLSTPLRPVTDGRMGRNWAVAAMLPEGSLSWDMRFVAGADTGAADQRLTRPESVDGLTLADTHFSVYQSSPMAAAYQVAQNFSVLRTGIGDLDLIAGGDLDIRSLYGVYTAGASTASRAGAEEADFNQPLANGTGASTYAAWYPDGGGNLLLRAGGDLTGDVLATYSTAASAVHDTRPQRSTADLGNWLWRQGSGDTAGVEPIPTSWWINFGTYVPGGTANNSTRVPVAADRNAITAKQELVGFVGIGTLGGGNLTVDVGGDAGMLTRVGNYNGLSTPRPRSQGLILTVAGTGRVLSNGEIVLTGGGDLDLRIGGVLNADLVARSSPVPNATPQNAGDYYAQNLNLTGVLTNLRGALDVWTGASGGIAFNYPLATDLRDVRPFDPYTATRSTASGGPVLMLGDAAMTLNTRGDLVVGGAGDPGRVALPYTPVYRDAGGSVYKTGGYGWFSLWTGNTAIDLFSAGGDLSPSQQLIDFTGSSMGRGRNFSPTDGRYVWPAQLSLTAADGSVFLGRSVLGSTTVDPNIFDPTRYSLLLAPSDTGRLAILAGDSIYASGYVVSRSGASPDVIPTPFNPAFAVFNGTALSGIYNLDAQAVRPSTNLFPIYAFGPGTARDIGPQLSPARLYARDGDIVGLGSGEIITFTSLGRQGLTWYEGDGAVWMRAGRDIVRSGMLLGERMFLGDLMSTPVRSDSSGGTSTGNLFVHADPTDVSIVEAGRDILFSNFSVAGPGTLEISAGRNILMSGQATIGTGGALAYGEAAVRSLGAIVPGDNRPGAGILVQAGVGAAGPDYAGLLPYLDPANLAVSGTPLADQPGKVAKTYEDKLGAWLEERYGYEAASDEEALAYFDALAPEQQRIFLRQVYYAEVREGGREYNDPESSRFGSYLRGRAAIAALFPDEDADGAGIVRTGDIIMFGGSGVHTDFGGDIQFLAPGGQILVGVEGTVPPSTAGVITQGSGDIQMYSKGSILLGLSRIMTTFGGDILGWSAEGDINAGRGAKTTIVFTPPKRVYDNYGNVTLSPTVPSSGAGIATLNPIAEVPPGDVDLIAPLGTIDAGEAGIRVSGNLNLAALQVLNAANIEVQGTATGIPVVAVPNVGAITTAANASGAVAASAMEAASRSDQPVSAQSLPTLFKVETIGYGPMELPPPEDDGDKRASRASGESQRGPVASENPAASSVPFAAILPPR
ncbi:filamentous hemagglutinin family protein [Termitidicoccus mucosus]|uniref:Filamentous haemagglutinin FhaB/tRNA nuclease CdiA-like TPS domain-containing protein n=1 Tax=Termitidicoccus mucosus TaxID=1184151 RepID=A0A178ILL9_9BACT|nr:hypothetical protein AW736_09930 [Opitutaceae bacterium TSB47]